MEVGEKVWKRARRRSRRREMREKGTRERR